MLLRPERRTPTCLPFRWLERVEGGIVGPLVWGEYLFYGLTEGRVDGVSGTPNKNTRCKTGLATRVTSKTFRHHHAVPPLMRFVTDNKTPLPAPQFPTSPILARSHSSCSPRSAPWGFCGCSCSVSVPSSMATASSYWCYRCSRFVRVWPQDAIVCPDCDGGFLEEISSPPPRLHPAAEPRRRRVPSIDAHALGSDWSAAAARTRQSSELRFGRNRRSPSGDRSPFNPVIVLRGQPDGGARNADRATTNSFELYYDDGTGSGLRPLPESISDFLMGSGFDRLLEQLAQIELNGIGQGRGCEHPPASKASIESMPTVEIVDDHIRKDCQCAICMDPFELGIEAREMPCKHIYHQDCILPWLSLRNSCPVCRHEMPSDVQGRGVAVAEGEEQAAASRNEEEAVGLTIWRLPGGGFAVGRFSGSRRAGEREFPVVYTEMDGGFNNRGTPRRISWNSTGSGRRRENGGIGQTIRNFFSLFRLSRSASSSSQQRSSESHPAFSHREERGSFFRRRSQSRGSNWDGNADVISR
ncbi:hypothetical protein BHM03_00018768 [Ensete ventricosum]|nr:hypothetical protein BHM03_00018768 [Ensete ventricosum]